MTAFDPWLPPPPGTVYTQPKRRRSPVLPIAIGVLALLVLVAGVARVVSRDPAGSADSPEDAVKAWFRAAATGDADALRATVAPSQRQYVAAADPTGLGLGRLQVEDLVVGDATTGHLAPDQAYVEIVGGTACREEKCFRVEGSGPEDKAMAVREGGRWWAVAAPVRLVPERPKRAVLKSVVTRHLELTGGVTLSLDEVEQVTNYSCRNLELKPFAFSSRERDVSLHVSADETDDPPGDDVIGPRLVHLRIDRKSWQPRTPLRVQRSPDGRSGSLVIDRWPGEPHFDEPAPAPVSGRLTWTCTEEA